MTARWGFIGAGWIARQAMAPAVHAAGNARLLAVASRERGRSAALEPSVIRSSYDEVIDDPDVDVVYVCLANHQHEEWVVRALAAGKHVLCEKPLAIDAAQAERMAAAARDADRLLGRGGVVPLAPQAPPTGRAGDLRGTGRPPVHRQRIHVPGRARRQLPR